MNKFPYIPTSSFINICNLNVIIHSHFEPPTQIVHNASERCEIFIFLFYKVSAFPFFMEQRRIWTEHFRKQSNRFF